MILFAVLPIPQVPDVVMGIINNSTSQKCTAFFCVSELYDSMLYWHFTCQFSHSQWAAAVHTFGAASWGHQKFPSKI
jgi:hypothetical protein